MPKKEKIEESKEETSDESKEESELEEVLDEASKEEFSEEIEEGKENIDDNRFVEFLQLTPSTEPSAPVLERIENAPIPESIENLEQNNFIPTTETEEDRSPVNYSPSSNEIDYSVSEERIKYQTSVEPPVLKPIESSEDFSRQELLNPMQERGIDVPDDLHPRMVDAGGVERESKLPFERDNKKYKKFGP